MLEEVLARMEEGITWSSRWRIEKFKKDATKPYEVLEWEGNLGLQEGRGELIDIICGLGTPTKWDNTNAYLGVGNSNTAASETDTGLLGASKLYKAMLATYPQRSNQTAEWKAEFIDGEAEFAWEEFTVCNTNSDAGVNLNRVVTSKGTKASGEVWTLSLKITFNAS